MPIGKFVEYEDAARSGVGLNRSARRPTAPDAA